MSDYDKNHINTWKNRAETETALRDHSRNEEGILKLFKIAIKNVTLLLLLVYFILLYMVYITIRQKIP